MIEQECKLYVTGVRVHLFRRNLRSSSANLPGILTNNFLVSASVRQCVSPLVAVCEEHATYGDWPCLNNQFFAIYAENEGKV